MKQKRFLPIIFLENKNISGFSGSVMVLTSIVAVLMIPLGEAITLVLSGPIFTMVLAKIFLKV
jgi:hypothetical protein